MGDQFLTWLEEWHQSRPAVSLAGDVIGEAGGAEHVAVMVVDLLVGFCVTGKLASPRVGALARPAARFLRMAWDGGVRSFVLNMDAHPADSPEFAAWPPHCIAGTAEAEPVIELEELPFYPEMEPIRKRSINIGQEADLAAWQTAHPKVHSWIVIGDCTDLCVYQAAMHLRLQANAQGRRNVTVWVPADLVETFDLPVETARRIGALPHDGDLMHRLFLYHMALNGINVVRSVRP